MAPDFHRDAVLIWTPAKINLFLEVRARRPDGYHEIETLMVAVNWFDTLEMQHDPSGEISLHCNRADLSTGDDNLVIRAAQLLRAVTGCTQGARIRLTKRIPMAAGLAGGSSDGAATLQGLNQLWRLGLSSVELARLAAQLGSDMAFFLSGSCAWATGRGEVITPMKLGQPLDFVLVSPGVGLSTPAVYRQVRVPAEPIPGDAVRRAVEAGDIETLGRTMFNRLEEPAMEISPVVREWHRRLANMGTAGCRMSGSGSSLFALCRNRAEATRVMHALREDVAAEVPGWSVVHIRTCF